MWQKLSVGALGVWGGCAMLASMGATSSLLFGVLFVGGLSAVVAAFIMGDHWSIEEGEEGSHD